VSASRWEEEGAAAEDVAVQLTGVVVEFPGVRALSDVDFSIRSGEVHGLIGLNGSGKTTLLNVISGVTRMTQGQIAIGGRVMEGYTAASARLAGIAVAHQVPQLFGNLDVVDNILIGRESTRRKLGVTVINRKDMEERASELLSRCGFALPLHARISGLSASQQKQVEIVKALSQDAPVVCLDEPTSMMAESDAKRLFHVMGELTKSGRSFVYVTHRIPEVMQISNRVTVLKNGCVVGRVLPKETSSEAMVQLMTGRALAAAGQVERHARDTGEAVVELRNVRTRPSRLGETALREVSFRVGRGEIVGIVGAAGAGKTELGKALVGMARIAQGEVRVLGGTVGFGSTAGLRRRGAVYVPEDITKEGLFPALNTRQNVCLIARGICRSVLISRRREREVAEELVNSLGVVPRNIEFPVRNLSGGNKKKVILGRALAAGARLLVLDELTMGVDVESAGELLRTVRELTDQGITIVLMSSEYERVLFALDRVLVMRDGQIVASLQGSDISEAVVTRCAVG
jgi:ABC-type sugar transport system ATPase subunit